MVIEKNRRCAKCMKTETYIDSKGHARWGKCEKGFLCHKCDNYLKWTPKRTREAKNEYERLTKKYIP